MAIELLSRSDHLFADNILLTNHLGADYLAVSRPKLARQQFERVRLLTQPPPPPRREVDQATNAHLVSEQRISATCHLALILKVYEHQIGSHVLALFAECFQAYSSEAAIFDDPRFYIHFADLLNRSLNQTGQVRKKKTTSCIKKSEFD